MKTFKRIPKHYRKLAAGEIVLKGDIYKKKGKFLEEAYGAIGFPAGDFDFDDATIWRRRHVSTKSFDNLVLAKKKVNAIEKNPLVTFAYPVSTCPSIRSIRSVRLISANDKYLVGIEISDKNRFKKFLVSKTSSLKVTEFHTGSMP
jgi:hypothetical protein